MFILLLSNLTGSAITTDDLVMYGGHAYEAVYGDINQNHTILWSHSGLRIEKINDQSFKIKGLYKGEYELTIDDYNPESGEFSIPSDHEVINMSDGSTATIFGIDVNRAVSRGNYYYNSLKTEEAISGKIEPFDENITMIRIPAIGINVSGKESYHNKIEVFVYKANATIEDNIKGEKRIYPVQVIMDGSNFQICNFSNLGCTFFTRATNKDITCNTSHYASGTINSDNSCTFKNMPIYSKFVSYLRCTQIPNYYYSSYKFSGYDDVSNVYLSGKTTSNSSVAVSGTSTDVDKLRHQTYIGYNWITNGGDLKTFEVKKEFAIPEYIYGSPATYNSWVGTYNPSLNVVEEIKSTTIHVYGDNEITHNHDLTFNGCYMNPNNEIIFLDGYFSNLKNTTHVKSFDIYAVPKQLSSINDSDFDYDPETGHKDAVFLYHKDFVPNLSRSTEMANINLGYMKEVPYSAISDENGNYTIFVKTNYSDESGLASTFHNMIACSSRPIVTSSPDIERDTDIDVEINGNSLTIGKLTTDYSVYNTFGRLLYRGKDSTITLPKGIYILSVGPRQRKVSIL